MKPDRSNIILILKVIKLQLKNVLKLVQIHMVSKARAGFELKAL